MPTFSVVPLELSISSGTDLYDLIHELCMFSDHDRVWTTTGSRDG